MDLRDGHIWVSVFLVLSMAYMFHRIYVLQEEVKRKSDLKTIYHIFSELERQRSTLKHIQDDIVSLRTKVDSSKVNIEDKLEDFKDSFGKILSEVQNVYKVAEEIHERINKLVDDGNRRLVGDGNRRFDIIVFIREGISRVIKFALDFFLGPVIKYLE